ncbi:hypothetical protein ID866_12935, partial [Astraeus odoratus]
MSNGPRFMYYFFTGEIVYHSVLGQDFIVINSEKVARALADQRSSIYSDRPHCSSFK